MSIRDQLRHRTPPPTGYYVYAYIDPRTDEPFYIGAGQGFRAMKHLQAGQQKRGTPFYRELKRLQASGRNPIICIIKAGLTKEQETSPRDV